MMYPNRYITYWKVDKDGEIVSNIATQVLCLKHREELMDQGYVLRPSAIADGWDCHKCLEEHPGHRGEFTSPSPCPEGS